MFSWHRFSRTFLNDFLAQSRKVLLASAGASAIGLFIFLINITGAPDPDPLRLYLLLFPVVLLGGGAIFTCLIFSDMHHPLERYHTLMLPVSPLERFLSRYLLSGPVFYLYALLFYALFEVLARLILGPFTSNPSAPFAPFSEEMRMVARAFFLGHAAMLLGAIFFRSYALPKTLVSLLLLELMIVGISIASIKVVFWDYFDSLFTMEMNRPMNISLGMSTLPDWVQFLLVAGFYLWVLFMAFTCLKDHEV